MPKKSKKNEKTDNVTAVDMISSISSGNENTDKIKPSKRGKRSPKSSYSSSDIKKALENVNVISKQTKERLNSTSKDAVEERKNIINEGISNILDGEDQYPTILSLAKLESYNKAIESNSDKNDEKEIFSHIEEIKNALKKSPEQAFLSWLDGSIPPEIATAINSIKIIQGGLASVKALAPVLAGGLPFAAMLVMMGGSAYYLDKINNKLTEQNKNITKLLDVASAGDATADTERENELRQATQAFGFTSDTILAKARVEGYNVDFEAFDFSQDNAVKTVEHAKNLKKNFDSKSIQESVQQILKRNNNRPILINKLNKTTIDPNDPFGSLGKRVTDFVLMADLLNVSDSNLASELVGDDSGASLYESLLNYFTSLPVSPSMVSERNGNSVYNRFRRSYNSLVDKFIDSNISDYKTSSFLKFWDTGEEHFLSSIYNVEKREDLYLPEIEDLVLGNSDKSIFNYRDGILTFKANGEFYRTIEKSVQMMRESSVITDGFNINNLNVIDLLDYGHTIQLTKDVERKYYAEDIEERGLMVATADRYKGTLQQELSYAQVNDKDTKVPISSEDLLKVFDSYNLLDYNGTINMNAFGDVLKNKDKRKKIANKLNISESSLEKFYSRLTESKEALNFENILDNNLTIGGDNINVDDILRGNLENVQNVDKAIDSIIDDYLNNKPEDETRSKDEIKEALINNSDVTMDKIVQVLGQQNSNIATMLADVVNILNGKTPTVPLTSNIDDRGNGPI